MAEDLADARHTDILSPQPGNTMVTFVSQMRKLRLREVI